MCQDSGVSEDVDVEVRALYQRIVAGWNADDAEAFAEPFADDGQSSASTVVRSLAVLVSLIRWGRYSSTTLRAVTSGLSVTFRGWGRMSPPVARCQRCRPRWRA